MAIKVTLRQKSISKGRLSLYLDFYPAITIAKTGKKTRREFLGLYIIAKPKSSFEKQQNKEIIHLAEQIRNKRTNELNKPEVYTAFELEQLKQKKKEELSFLDYYEAQIEKKNGATYAVWTSSFNYLKRFTNNHLKFSEVTEKFCNDYREYLLETPSIRSNKSLLSRNSAHSYFNKFKAALKQAYKDDLLPRDLNGKIKPIKQADTKRIFLSKEELNKLANTDCANEILKKASLFSALTGLRFSDIQKLSWDEVIFIKDQGYFIQFQQKKTKSLEYLPIPDQAYELMGMPQDSNQRVFNGLIYSAHLNSQLLKWAIKAKVQKSITFHCFRHTYATLQLQGGTDIYTVSKMLGHKDLKTTQIYAKVVDKTKRDATKKIKLSFE